MPRISMPNHDHPPAHLVLADGRVYAGLGWGAAGTSLGELVFNTSLTGYQEILTDPSYHRQIILMTAPHIGNYGVTPEDDESDRVWAAGLGVRAASRVTSSWRAAGSLASYLADRGIVALTEVDTRAAVRHVRDQGAMWAVVSNDGTPLETLHELVRTAPSMAGLDLCREVSCRQAYAWPTAIPCARVSEAGRWTPLSDRPYRVAAFDFGIKRNALRHLAARGCEVTVLPAATTAAEVMALAPDGLFLSSGPGDPAAVTYAHETIRQLLGRLPLFGICMGHQLLASALGARTYKLKFGHRGGNQPVSVDGRVEISAHNHGFAVDAAGLPEWVHVSHRNLNDGCVEGLRIPAKWACSVQYHPEAAPGPHDSEWLFDAFVRMMAAYQADPESVAVASLSMSMPTGESSR